MRCLSAYNTPQMHGHQVGMLLRLRWVIESISKPYLRYRNPLGPGLPVYFLPGVSWRENSLECSKAYFNRLYPRKEAGEAARGSKVFKPMPYNLSQRLASVRWYTMV